MNIIKKPNPILLKKLKYVEQKPSERSIFEMCDLMTMAGGVGLAAKQVGIDQAFFIAKFSRAFTVCINPQIRSHGRQEINQGEGCLSILDDLGKSIYAPKKRWAVVDVVFQTMNGFASMTLKYNDARIFQHEMDHLEGRLCQ